MIKKTILVAFFLLACSVGFADRVSLNSYLVASEPILATGTVSATDSVIIGTFTTFDGRVLRADIIPVPLDDPVFTERFSDKVFLELYRVSIAYADIKPATGGHFFFARDSATDFTGNTFASDITATVDGLDTISPTIEKIEFDKGRITGASTVIINLEFDKGRITGASTVIINLND